MLFDKKNYYILIKLLESKRIVNIIIFIGLFATLFFLLSYMFNQNTILFSILGIFVGLLLGYIYTCFEDIKIEEMKMKLDIYEKIMRDKQ